MPVLVADAARIPIPPQAADLVVAFMSLHDVDDLESAVSETARILTAGGCLCMAVVHPLNSAGEFEEGPHDGQRPFVIRGSYLASTRYVSVAERDGLTMRFESNHHPLQAFTQALERAGLVIEALREATEPEPDDQWYRVPLLLDLRARKR